jgi:glucose-1-phosphate thymidylyltransferase
VEKPENPKSNLALAGLYFIRDQRILKAAIEQLIKDDITTRGEYQLTDALQLLIQQGESIQVKEIDGWYDCGTRESLLESHRFLLKSNNSQAMANGAIIRPPVFIHPEAIVQNSIIGPYVTLDKGSRVTNAVISNTIVSRFASIESMILKDSLIGESAIAISPARTINIGDYSELKFD